MNLNTFISNYKDGFQSSSKFTCQIFLPLQLLATIVTQSLIDNAIDFLIPTGDKDAKGILSAPIVATWLGRGLAVEAARLPSRAFETVDLSMYGLTERFPTHSEYTSLDCVFLMPFVGNDNGVPKFFNYWQNYIQNNQFGPQSGLNFQFPSTYYGTILLSLLDNKGEPSVTYQFDKVYPHRVESVGIQWDQSNEHARLPVSFHYSYWKIVPSVPLPIF